jgi:hypothetical protein
MKTSIFWDITPCSPLELNRRFGGTCRQGKNQRKRRWQACFFLGLFFGHEDGEVMFFRNVINFERTIRRYRPEYRTLHNFNLVQYKPYFTLRLIRTSTKMEENGRRNSENWMEPALAIETWLKNHRPTWDVRSEKWKERGGRDGEKITWKRSRIIPNPWESRKESFLFS